MVLLAGFAPILTSSRVTILSERRFPPQCRYLPDDWHPSLLFCQTMDEYTHVFFPETSDTSSYGSSRLLCVKSPNIRPMIVVESRLRLRSWRLKPWWIPTLPSLIPHTEIRKITKVRPVRPMALWCSVRPKRHLITCVCRFVRRF
jgi:hypothetical protein